jgi:hypothetical protein
VFDSTPQGSTTSAVSALPHTIIRGGRTVRPQVLFSRLASLPLGWVALELAANRRGPPERFGHRKAYRATAASIATTVSSSKRFPAAFGTSRPTRMSYFPLQGPHVLVIVTDPATCSSLCVSFCTRSKPRRAA